MRIRRRPEVVSISSARTSQSDEVASRTRKYLFSMAVRTICFVGGVFAWTVLHWTAVAVVLMIAAFVLPYLAVVAANAGRESAAPKGPDSVLPAEDLRALRQRKG